MQTADVSEAVAVITLNRWFLSCMGLWPQSTRDPIIVLFLIYLFTHIALAITELFEYGNDARYAVANITENVFLVMTCIKIGACRLGKKAMNEFLQLIESDFCASSYKSADEVYTFLYYNKFTLRFMKVSMVMTVITGILYYLKVFYGSLDMGIPGASGSEYVTPYRTRPFIEVNTQGSYIFICIYQTVIIYISVFGYAAPDSFFISMTLHVCAQFSVLSCQVKETLNDTNDSRQGLRKVIIRHQQLIRLAETLETHFNIVFLFQFVSTTFLLCLTGYHALTNSENGEKAYIMVYVMYVMCVISTLFVYSFVGECLISEVYISMVEERWFNTLHSTGLGEALYASNWYKISPIHLKLMQICMVRTGKPLTLTSGKFCVLSLSTFTDIIKTSLAYLSFLRNSV